jgi:YbbR domain-containing protein
MIELITRNIWWKLFAILIAVLLWIAVANEPELSTFVSVPLEFKDLPENLEISSEIVEKVELEMRGPSGELRNFSGHRTAVVLDLSDAGPGERTYGIQEDSLHLPRGLHLIRAIPSQVHFIFELRRERTVPVEVRFSGTPPKFEVSPRSLTIEGPESRVKRVTAVVTDRIDAEKLKGPTTLRVNTFTPDPYVRIKSDSEVTVKVMAAVSPG